MGGVRWRECGLDVNVKGDLIRGNMGEIWTPWKGGSQEEGSLIPEKRHP